MKALKIELEDTNYENKYALCKSKKVEYSMQFGQTWSETLSNTLDLMSLWAVMFGFCLIHGPQNNYFLTPWSCLVKTLICNIFKWFKRSLWGLFEFPQLKQPYSNRSVLCQGFLRGGFEGMIHFSKPYQLHPTPPYNNATVCSPRSLDAHTPPCPHVRCCCVVLFPHSWSISLCTPPPLHPSAFPPFNPNNASVLPATLCRLFQRTSKKEKQIEAAGDNETAG